MFARILKASTLPALVFSSTLSLMPVVSQADVVGTLSFTDPLDRVVGPNETIEVWVTLTLDEFSDSLVFDSSLEFYGFDESELPTEAYNWQTDEYETFESYDYVGAFSSRSCNDTFTSSESSPCRGGEYSANSVNGQNSWFGQSSLELHAEESISFLLYEFAPKEGGAAEGTYEATSLGFGLTVYGTSLESGGELDADLFRFSTSDCFSGPECTFTRTVAVPLPAASLLYGFGLLTLGLLRERPRG